MNSLLNKLNGIITEFEKIGIAYSGGVDSTLLLYLASLKRPVVAIIIDGPMVPRDDLKEAIAFAQSLDNVNLITVPVNILNIEDFRNNTPERCYYCKKALFELIDKTAKENGCDIVFDGSNLDDLGDYRPGMKAVKELGVLSPFIKAGINKADIYNLSNFYDLPTKNKPAAACLASRIKTGETITLERLKKIEQGERFLKTFPFKQLRLRLLGPDYGYIEIDRGDFDLFYNNSKKIKDYMNSLGITIGEDPKEYKQGNMNIRS